MSLSTGAKIAIVIGLVAVSGWALERQLFAAPSPGSQGATPEQTRAALLQYDTTSQSDCVRGQVMVTIGTETQPALIGCMVHKVAAERQSTALFDDLAHLASLGWEIWAEPALLSGADSARVYAAYPSKAAPPPGLVKLAFAA